MPIIPMVLVNGSDGVGMGWSSNVPNYNPRDIIANIRHLIEGEPMKPMDPWYKDFKGVIKKTTSGDDEDFWEFDSSGDDEMDLVGGILLVELWRKSMRQPSRLPNYPSTGPLRHTRNLWINVLSSRYDYIRSIKLLVCLFTKNTVVYILIRNCIADL